jgi:hypothetical protein
MIRLALKKIGDLERVVPPEMVQVAGIEIEKESFDRMLETLMSMGAEQLKIVRFAKLHADHPMRKHYLDEMKRIVPSELTQDPAILTKVRAALMDLAIDKLEGSE